MHEVLVAMSVVLVAMDFVLVAMDVVLVAMSVVSDLNLHRDDKRRPESVLAPSSKGEVKYHLQTTFDDLGHSDRIRQSLRCDSSRSLGSVTADPQVPSSGRQASS